MTGDNRIDCECHGGDPFGCPVHPPLHCNRKCHGINDPDDLCPVHSESLNVREPKWN